MLASIEAFESAIRLDPEYALAHAGLATVLARSSVRYAHERDALKWGKRADAAATRALALDHESAEAHLAIASTAGTLYGHFNWPRVLAEVDAAVAINPSIDIAYRLRGRALYHLGLFDAANEAVATALSLNPSVDALRIRVAVDLFGGRFAEVRARGEELIREAETPVLKTYVGAALFYLGERERAASLLASVKRGDQPDARSAGRTGGSPGWSRQERRGPDGYRPTDPRPLHGPSCGVQPRCRVCAAAPSSRSRPLAAPRVRRRFSVLSVVRGEIRCSNRFGVIRATRI